jgi:DNA-binding FadR family transcriptional regulator
VSDTRPAPASRGLELGPIRQPQLYEQIAEQIADQIMKGVQRPQDQLPSERDLANQLEVGRPSVREALAALQNAGVIETRRGAGSFIAGDAIERLRSRGDGRSPDLSPVALLDARDLFEPEVARLAAERGQHDPVVEELLEQMARTTDPEDAEAHRLWSEADRQFHRQIAIMTGNPLIAQLATVVSDAMGQALWQRMRDAKFEHLAIASPGRIALFTEEHRMIYEAITSNDPEAAAFYAREHVARVRRDMALTPVNSSE